MVITEQRDMNVLSQADATVANAAIRSVGDDLITGHKGTSIQSSDFQASMDAAFSPASNSVHGQDKSNGLSFDQKTVDQFHKIEDQFQGIVANLTSNKPDLANASNSIEGLRQQLKGLAGKQDNASEAAIFQTLRGDLNQVRRAAFGHNRFFKEPNGEVAAERALKTAKAFDFAEKELSGVDTGIFSRNPSQNDLAQLGVNRNNFSLLTDAPTPPVVSPTPPVVGSNPTPPSGQTGSGSVISSPTPPDPTPPVNSGVTQGGVSKSNGLSFDQKTLDKFNAIESRFEGILANLSSRQPDLAGSSSSIEGIRQQLKALAGEQDNASEAAIFQTLRGDLNQVRRAAAGNNGFFREPNAEVAAERALKTAKAFDFAEKELSGVDTGIFSRNPNQNDLAQLGVNRNNFGSL
jgi:archaellum component FlaC